MKACYGRHADRLPEFYIIGPKSYSIDIDRSCYMGLAVEEAHGDRFYTGTGQRCIIAEYGAWHYDLGCLISYASGFEAGSKRYLEEATKQGQLASSGQT